MERTAPVDFTEFMRARWGTLFRTAYLLTGNRHDAEELLQEALARTCTKWGSIRDKGAAEAYVRRILVHEAGRGWRRRDRERVTDAPPDAGSVGGDSDQHVDLWRAICALPPRMRAALVLRYYEDLSVGDTALALACSEGAVKSQTHAAVKRLRGALGPSVEPAREGQPWTA